MAAALTSLLGETLLSAGGSEVPTSEALAGKNAVILYFSAHWCPPCRGFTPALADAYKSYKASGGAEAEVVFVSWDNDVEQFKEYFGEMPWLALPKGSDTFDKIKEELGEKFEVGGIPHLVALGPDGTQINAEADLRQLVSQHKGDAFPMTASHVEGLAKKAKEARNALLTELQTSASPAILPPGGGDAVTVGDALVKYEHLALLFSDGDGSDATYKNLSDIVSEVNDEGGKANRLGLLYIGFSKYNDQCDHNELYGRHQAQYYGLLAPSEEEKAKLSKLASKGVGAPHFLVLARDSSGSLTIVADEPGCQKVLELGASAYPWSTSRIEEIRAAAEARVNALKEKQTNLQFLKGSDGRDGLFTKDGAEVKVDKLASEDSEAVVGIYFSAHWCPPCRGFTPKLAELHKELKDAGKNFEVIFVSGDKDEEAFKEYMAEMPWLAVPFSERDLCKDLNKVFEVRGIPTLVLLKPDGTLITKNGREAATFGAECFPWSPEDMQRGKAEAARKETEKRKAAIEAEAKVLEMQKASGGPVLKRLRGTPGTALTHDLSARTIKFAEFATIGAPESLAKSGTIYYELEVVSSQGIPQIGFATSSFEICDSPTGEGVGDDKCSWGFDGTRACAWFGGDKPWGGQWAVGDVIGFASNIDAGKIAVSKNGVWTESPQGVFFVEELIKSGVYPCLTAAGGYKVRYNLDGTSHGPFKHGPPSSEVWDTPCRQAGYAAA